MRVRRDISSIPHRSASETWQRIIDLVTGADSKDAASSTAAAGVMASIITDEHPGARADRARRRRPAASHLLPLRHGGR